MKFAINYYDGNDERQEVVVEADNAADAKAQIGSNRINRCAPVSDDAEVTDFTTEDQQSESATSTDAAGGGEAPSDPAGGEAGDGSTPDPVADPPDTPAAA